MQNMQNTLLSRFILYCSTCGGWRIPWMLILLLSRGMGGKAKVVYDVWWYSYRKRAILSGSTDRTSYLPYSPAFPCNIVSHLNAWYPRLWIPPPASLCVKNLRILARFQMLMRIPQKSPLVIMGPEAGSAWYQRSALRGTPAPVLASTTCQSSISHPSSSLAVMDGKNHIHMQYTQQYAIYAKYEIYVQNTLMNSFTLYSLA